MSANLLGGTAIKPPERHGFEAFKWFMYDPDKVPRWETDNSIIGSSPALGVRPEQEWARVDSSMIIYNQAHEASSADMPGWKEWADRSTEFLEAYKKQDNAVDCPSSGPAAGQVCNFDLAQLGPCGEGNYGYDKGKPCIFLKLNKIYNLVHDYYNDPDAMPSEVPADVKARIAEQKLTGDDLNQVWIDCHGENPADREAMGDLKYFPESAAFHGKYYPYTNQDGYVNPLVAVQFLNPEAGRLLHIECRAYAGNINYDRRDKIGKAHFEVLVHNEKTAK